MKLSLISVKRDEFVTDKGEVVKYCKFSGLTPIETSENQVGSRIESFNTKYENYSRLVDLLNKKQIVEVEVDYARQLNGLFKQKAKKINGIEL